MQDSTFGFDFPFQVFPILFTLVFIVIFVFVIITIIRSLSQWNKNNHSPVLTVEATVAAKRSDVRTIHHQANANADYNTSSTTYYVTFQVESGDRMELIVLPEEYGLLAEGDSGRLTFQGTRYKGFERNY